MNNIERRIAIKQLMIDYIRNGEPELYLSSTGIYYLETVPSINHYAENNKLYRVLTRKPLTIEISTNMDYL